MKLQSKDSYQPRERGDHSKRWIRGGEGSMDEGSVLGGVVVSVLERRVSIVCKGREGSQESICISISGKLILHSQGIK